VFSISFTVVSWLMYFGCPEHM